MIYIKKKTTTNQALNILFLAILLSLLVWISLLKLEEENETYYLSMKQTSYITRTGSNYYLEQAKK